MSENSDSNAAGFAAAHRDFAADRANGVLATIRRNGRPQLSNITYHLDPHTDLVGISVTADRAKTRNVVRDPRVSLQVSSEDFWSYVVLDGDAELSPVAADPHDDTVDALVEHYRVAAGKDHPDWEEFRAAMVDQRRQLLTFTVQRSYGLVRPTR